MQHEEGGYALLAEAVALQLCKPADDAFVVVQSGWTKRYHVIREFAIDRWRKQGYTLV